MENYNFFQILILNIIVCVLWHLFAMILCMRLNEEHFNYKLSIYKIKHWEKNGRFYIKYFKIKKWKDLIPTHIGKNGFSKKNLDLKNMNDDYFDKFIIETCRGEWNHFISCFYAVIAFIINPIVYAVIFSVIVIIFNIACIIIQRYNRIRILRLKEKVDSKNNAKFKLDNFYIQTDTCRE